MFSHLTPGTAIAILAILADQGNDKRETVQPVKGELVPFKRQPRQGRNEKCSCGSGKKFKNCCLHK